MWCFFFPAGNPHQSWKYKVLTRMVYAWGFGISMIRWVEIGTLQPSYHPQHNHLLFMLREFFQKLLKASWYILGQNYKRRQVIRLAKIQKFDHLLGWQAWRTGRVHIASENAKWCTAPMEGNLIILSKNTYVYLPLDLEIPILGIFPKI